MSYYFPELIYAIIKNTLHLFNSHELRVIQILDKTETNFNVYGSLELEDSETGEKLETYISER
ncbi:MAG: hypothetical protein ACPLW7_06705, partial [Minisyncoccia bacterium]